MIAINKSKAYSKLIISIIIGLIFFGCKKNQETKNINFELKSNTGIEFSNDLLESNELNIIEYLYYYNGAGVAVGDINNDGLEDIYFAANEKGDKLYLNKGDLKFEDITERAGINTKRSWSTGVSMDDLNNDGLLDIYVCKVGLFYPDAQPHNELYINQGNGTFKEQSKEYGLNFKGFSTQSCFFDYDHDGDLDMYLLNHAIHTVRSYGSSDKRTEKDSLSGDLFFENRLKEEGKFVNVTEKAGIFNSPLGYGLAVSCGDINNDGWTDIYVGNDFHENDYLYINNGNKTFTESLSKYMSHTTQFSMGADIADMNNDGWYDLFTTDMMPYDPEVTLVSGGEDTDNIKRIKRDLGFTPQNARNHFQINQKNAGFTDIAFLTGTYATDWSWSVLLQDFDNNGLNDIFITNGIVKRPNDLEYINFLNEFDAKGGSKDPQRSKKLIEKMPSQPLSNVLFSQTGDLEFTPLLNSFIGKPSFSTGAAYSDFDNDGDLDIITNNINQKAFLYENKSSKNNFIKIRLADSNTSVKGSRLILYADNKIYTRELQTTKGFMSASSHTLHFGLGDVKKVDSLIIVWPDMTKQIVNKIELNKLNEIKKNQVTKFDYTSFFAKGNLASTFSYVHQDNYFYDEDREKLIPERLSFEGPALISEDLNGDGHLDLFIGGAREQTAKLMLGTKDGKYVEKKNPDFDVDKKFEDVDAATIDFDGDGDKDIYVVSGGNDAKELDKSIEDRIYLNNGNGVFRRIPISLPVTNGSCVRVADIDGDGFQDLFIGARDIPGFYGLSPYSFILKNRKGSGVDILNKERFGMIKDAQFADIDNDKDPDLIMCGDWMGIVVLVNENGQFTEKTKAMGFADIKGFWNTIEVVDVNGDGKKDILAGNAGLNHKWNASKDKPIKLHIGDFDKNGATDPLIFHHYFNRYIPFATMDKLVSHIPSLKKQLLDYKKFRVVDDINDLFPNYKENEVEYKEVNELRSMVFINNDKTFTAYPLNKEEQYSDINDFELDELGRVFYIGNNHEYVSELGMCSSNSGKILGKYNSNTKKFEKSSDLGLPHSLNTRRIRKLGNDKMLIVGNNTQAYVLN